MTTTSSEPDEDFEPELPDVDADGIGDVDASAAALELLRHGFPPDVDLGLTSHLDERGQPRIIERHLHVLPELAGLRLDHFVKTQIPRLSRTKIQGVIDTQLRRIDGTKAKPSTSVVAGEHY